MPDTIVFLIAGVVVLLFASWAGWHVGGWRRNTKPPILPDRVWLCDACKSFNDPTHLTCYRCHQPRAADAREIEPDPDFHIDQQLGRSKSSLDWGASSPWLAADDPLRDAWLSDRARPTEAALAESTPDPEFRAGTTTGAPDADPPEPEAAPSPPIDPDDAPLASGRTDPGDAPEDAGTPR